MPTLDALAPLDPLPRWLFALARRRGLARAARLAAPLSALALATALALARFVPHAPRALALLWLAPAFYPLFSSRKSLLRDPLPAVLEIDRAIVADAAVLTAAEHALSPGAAPPDALRARIARDARDALSRARARDALPRFGGVTIALFATTALALAGALVIPVPPRPKPVVAMPVNPPAVVPPRVRDPDLAHQAERVAEHMESAAREDPEHARRPLEVAAEARALARDLSQQGLPSDQALLRMDALERHARQASGWSADAAHRAGVDAATQALAAEPAASEMADALARGDMNALDRAARRVADRQEARSRRAAQEALRRAAEAARRQGSGDVADTLDEERRLISRRGIQSELANAVADALHDRGAQERIRSHLRGGADEDVQRAMEEAMREFDRGLSDQERREIARRLAEMSQNADAEDRASLERASRRMTPAEAREAMRQLLEQMRRGGEGTRPGRAGSEGQAGAAEAQAMRVRFQLAQGGGGSGNGSGNGGSGNGSGNGGSGNGSGNGGSGGEGHSEGGGHVDSHGGTQGIRAGGFVAPVRTNADPNHPGVTVGTEMVDPTGASASASEDVQIRNAAPAALRGLDRTPVPPPYRDQVREYFGGN